MKEIKERKSMMNTNEITDKLFKLDTTACASPSKNTETKVDSNDILIREVKISKKKSAFLTEFTLSKWENNMEKEKKENKYKESNENMIKESNENEQKDNFIKITYNPENNSPNKRISFGRNSINSTVKNSTNSGPILKTEPTDQPTKISYKSNPSLKKLDNPKQIESTDHSDLVDIDRHPTPELVRNSISFHNNISRNDQQSLIKSSLRSKKNRIMTNVRISKSIFKGKKSFNCDESEPITTDFINVTEDNDDGSLYIETDRIKQLETSTKFLPKTHKSTNDVVTSQISNRKSLSSSKDDVVEIRQKESKNSIFSIRNESSDSIVQKDSKNSLNSLNEVFNSSKYIPKLTDRDSDIVIKERLSKDNLRNLLTGRASYDSSEKALEKPDTSRDNYKTGIKLSVKEYNFENKDSLFYRPPKDSIIVESIDECKELTPVNPFAMAVIKKNSTDRIESNIEYFKKIGNYEPKDTSSIEKTIKPDTNITNNTNNKLDIPESNSNNINRPSNPEKKKDKPDYNFFSPRLNKCEKFKTINRYKASPFDSRIDKNMIQIAKQYNSDYTLSIESDEPLNKILSSREGSVEKKKDSNKAISRNITCSQNYETKKYILTEEFSEQKYPKSFFDMLGKMEISGLKVEKDGKLKYEKDLDFDLKKIEEEEESELLKRAKQLKPLNLKAKKITFKKSNQKINQSLTNRGQDRLPMIISPQKNLIK
ncbi:MAG: hypothetical protein GW795_04560, partial [Cyanobacteria bacterium]|nr:hypothetical protein [Cyanobacteria bacterium CG_2015-04_32_10]